VKEGDKRPGLAGKENDREGGVREKEWGERQSIHGAAEQQMDMPNNVSFCLVSPCKCLHSMLIIPLLINHA
jgi:hypothetical protein